MSGLDKEARQQIGQRIRDFREMHKPKKISLDQFADLVARKGYERPSAAKLSRIETGDQPVSLDILPAVSSIVGIPPEELRPDVAKKFEAAQ